MVSMGKRRQTKFKDAPIFDIVNVGFQIFYKALCKCSVASLLGLLRRKYRYFCTFNFNVRRIGRYTVPCVKDHNPLGTQIIVSLIFEQEQAHWGQPEKLQLTKLNTLQSANRRKMAKILPNRRKTLKLKFAYLSRVSVAEWLEHCAPTHKAVHFCRPS